MKFLIVTPTSIYHGCSTRKTFWEEKFTSKKQDFFETVNMRNCGKRNFRKHREIKDIDECVTLKAYENMYEILKFSEKFDSEDVVSIVSRLSNFSENFKISYIFSYAFKVTSSSLSLIYL